MTFPDAVQSLDERLLRAAQGTPHFLVIAFWLLTVVGGGWGLFIVAPFAYRKATRRAVLWLLGAEIVVSELVNLLKGVFTRIRPCDALGWCPAVIVGSPGGHSFPSGHPAGSFTFAVFVVTLEPRLAAIALPLAAGIAWSRCVLGVHYPSDVFVGALFGSSFGFLAARGYRHFEAKRKAKALSAASVEVPPAVEEPVKKG